MRQSSHRAKACSHTDDSRVESAQVGTVKLARIALNCSSVTEKSTRQGGRRTTNACAKSCSSFDSQYVTHGGAAVHGNRRRRGARKPMLTNFDGTGEANLLGLQYQDDTRFAPQLWIGRPQGSCPGAPGAGLERGCCGRLRLHAWVHHSINSKRSRLPRRCARLPVA